MQASLHHAALTKGKKQGPLPGEESIKIPMDWGVGIHGLTKDDFVHCMITTRREAIMSIKFHEVSLRSSGKTHLLGWMERRTSGASVPAINDDSPEMADEMEFSQLRESFDEPGVLPISVSQIQKTNE